MGCVVITHDLVEASTLAVTLRDYVPHPIYFKSQTSTICGMQQKCKTASADDVLDMQLDYASATLMLPHKVTVQYNGCTCSIYAQSAR